MFKKDVRVNRYIKGAAPFAKPILNQLRKIVQQACPQAEETIKWDSPFYIFNEKIICGMGTFKGHCKFWVKNWKSIAKNSGQREKLAMEQMLHIYKVSDLPNSNIIKSLLKQAVKFNEPGAKPTKKRIKKVKPAAKTPPDLMRDLRDHPKALAVYEGFSQSIKRHYVDWITDAKTQETRMKRLKKAIECIADGKTRHWENKKQK